MRIWVSGAAGKLGVATVRQLQAAGHGVIAADRRPFDGSAVVDLRDFAATKASMSLADAVVHLAARPSPENIEPSTLVENNVMATFNVFQAASELGIARVVLASSGSIYGYAWSPVLVQPPWVPVDEHTSLDYVDPYALTKDVGERIGSMFARRGMTVIALRFHWILKPTELNEILGNDDGLDGAKNLWGYVRLDDAARACVNALDADLPAGSFVPLVIAAATTRAGASTDRLLQRWYPHVERRRVFAAHDGLFDISAARRLIGWAPTPDR